MKYPDDDFSPLFVFGVSFIELGQSSEFAGAVNNLTLRIASSVEHVAPTKIKMSGLLPTQTPSGTLVLTDDGYGVFASIAQWNSTEGSLHIEILTTMTKKLSTIYHFRYSLLLHNMQGLERPKDKRQNDSDPFYMHTVEKSRTSTGCTHCFRRSP